MKELKSYNLASEDELESFSKNLLADLNHPLCLFIGDLGAGKTTIIKRLLQQLGSQDSGSSPSYSIINEYKAQNGPVFHVDLYRLNSAEEVFQLGIEDVIYSGHPCFMEWPQLILDYIDPPYHVVKIEVNPDNSRIIRLS